MSTHEPTDPFRGASFETIQRYTNLLLGAAELQDTLSSQHPTAVDQLYTISNPIVIERIDLPEPLNDFVRYGNAHLISISFRSIIKYTDSGPLVSSSVDFEFDDEQHDSLIEIIDDLPYLLYKNRENIPALSLSTRAVSNVVSRMAFPYADPNLTDFRNINDSRSAHEICYTLDSTDFVTNTIERVYEIDNDYQVIIQTSGDKIMACEITEFRDSDVCPVTLTVEFNHFSNASSLYKVLEDGSEELIMDEGDLERYIAIIDRIKQKLQPPISDIDPDSLS